MLVLIGVSAITMFVSPVEAQEVNTVKGKVVNSISGEPVAGVTVEISPADKASTAPVVTGPDGLFEFPDLGTLQPPYRLDFTMRKYKPKTIQPVDSGADLLVELEPGNIQTPIAAPRVYSGPRSVRIEWDPNPEYNIAGYNVYRRTVTELGEVLIDWNKLNTSVLESYVGYIPALEYIDDTVEPSTYYQYATQAVSDVDRYTELSPASEIVKGQWLTVFFPEQVNYEDAGLFLWERNPEDPQETQVRIPVNSKSVYDVSATSIQIDSELPAGLLLDPDTINVEPSGITAGMMMSAYATPQGDKISVIIASAGVEESSLYGSGTLFNIIAKPNLSVPETQCGPLHLIPDDGLGNGVRMYDVISDMTTPLDLELEDGQLCVTGGCIHGDADFNQLVDIADAQYVLDYRVRKVTGNDCIAKSGDINLDGLVDSADSSLIQRWLAGLNITPPNMKESEKGYDGYIQNIKWLADSGSLAAEARLADLEKADVSVNVWLSERLTGSAGSQKIISVLANNVSNIAGFNMVLNFDKDFATVDSVQLGSAASELTLSYNDDVNATGNLRISAADAQNIGVKGSDVELITIQFTMLKDGDAELEIEQVHINDIYAYVPKFDDPKAPKILNKYENITMPDIQGLSQGTALDAIHTAGYIRWIDTYYECNDSLPPWTVLYQYPAPGTIIDPVNDYISIGISIPCFEVPDIVGLSMGAALDTIHSANFVGDIDTEYVCNDSVPAWTVLYQYPDAGNITTQTGYVVLTVAVPCGEVPNVVGMDIDDATAAIRAAGFVGSIGTYYEYNDTLPPWTVTYQSPEAGSIVQQSVYIELTVAIPYEFVVPDVVGMNEDAAREAIQSLGFVGSIDTYYVFNDTVPPGTVLYQYPEAGSIIYQYDYYDGYIELTIAVPSQVQVPDVVGMNEDTAREAIQSLGFVGSIDTYYVCNDTVPPGTVLEQYPEPGSIIGPFDYIELSISTQSCIETPNVVGMSESDANYAIRAAGFYGSIYTYYECSDTVPPGTVLAQYPEPGNMVNIYDYISLTISKPYFEVPNVVGMNVDDAFDAISSAGFNGEIYVSYEFSDTAPLETVITQYPDAGALICDVYDYIELVVSMGPGVIVPNVVGMEEKEAIDTLEAAGLVAIVSYECNNEVSPDTVISQSPTSEEEVALNSEVYITVSVGLCSTIEIDSIGELQLIGNDRSYPINGNYELTQDLDASETIDWNDGAGFKPIGTTNNPFRGVFNGNGHVIRGLYINRPYEGYVSLFGIIGDIAEIHNLGIENCRIVGDYEVGSLGSWNYGTITGCYSTGCIYGNNNYVGGLLSSNSGTVSNCYSMCSIWGYGCVGGLIGWNESSVNNCFSIGTVSSYEEAGGLIDCSGGYIENSYWDMETSGVSWSSGGEGKTTAEMMLQATYAGWDFVTIWAINEGVSYPYFIWQGAPPLPVEGECEGIPIEGEGYYEGSIEGSTEGISEGYYEGSIEGSTEGISEGEPIPQLVHSADQDGNYIIDLTELLRVIQFFNMGGYYPCPGVGEDGFCPGPMPIK